MDKLKNRESKRGGQVQDLSQFTHKQNLVWTDDTPATAAFDVCLPGREGTAAAGGRRDYNLLNPEIDVTLVGVPGGGDESSAAAAHRHRDTRQQRRGKNFHAGQRPLTRSVGPSVRRQNRFPEDEKKRE